jgi:hypothetical protein
MPTALSEILLERLTDLALDLFVLSIAGACFFLMVSFVVAVVAGAIAEFRQGGAGLERSP